MTDGKETTYVAPPGFPKPLAALSYATKTKPNASIIFVSGLGSIDDDGKSLVGFNIYEQTCRCMDRIAKVLAAAEATLDDVVNLRVFITDIENSEKCCEAYSKYFNKLPAVVLEALPGLIHGPGQLVEIEATAAV